MFASDLPTALAEALSGRGYAEPTPVQAAVVEDETRGRDLLVSARTGSGKTVAYGLAMAPELFVEGRPNLPPAGIPLALVIAPTRELALQVQRELEWLYAGAGGRVVACVGGMDPRREHRMLAAGCHIVVGTPGRLRDHIERGQLMTAGLKVVVLDEADEMLDLGFREELEEILDTTPTERRTLLFSATLPKPIISLATRYQRDALRLEIGAGERSHADIAYQAVRTAPSDVTGAVVNLLRYHDAGAALVFCNLRATVARLHADLVERGFAVVALSGELSQGERTKALQSLRDGRAKVCVATDVAARGIDIPDLELVIHADLPANIETLQHRSGRTGRAGRKGLCAVVVPYPRQRKAELLFRNAKIEPEWLLAPSSDLIRERDRARLSAELTANAPEEGDEDLTAARVLLEEHSAETLVVALVRLNRARLPAPEELHDGPASAAPVPGLSAFSPFNAAPRPGFEDTAWFRLDLGRSRNADPKWILPLICRRGHITKTDIGAIRIFDRETRFQITREVEARFLDAIAREPDEEPRIEPIDADLAPPPERDKKPFKAKKRSNAEGGDKPAWDKPKSSYDPAAGERAGEAKPAWERKPKRDYDRPQAAAAASGEVAAKPAWERKPKADYDRPRAEAAPSHETAAKPAWERKPRRDDDRAQAEPAASDLTTTKPAWERKGEPAAEGKRGYPKPRTDGGAKPAWGDAPKPAYDKAKPKSKSNAGPKAGWMDKPAYDPAAEKPPFKKKFKPTDGPRVEGGEAGEPRGKPHAPWAGKAQGAKTVGAKTVGAKPYAPKTHAGADGKAKPFKPYAGAKKAKKRD